MRHAALDIIRHEHHALASMLRSLSLLLAKSSRESEAPDFDVIRAMLLYIDEFPERLHHTKESQLLFPMLRAKAPDLSSVIDRLESDHASGERAIRELQHALLAFEVLGSSRRAEFKQALDRYVEFYLEHMRLEETALLPAALRCLTADDWASLDAAFTTNRDPLTGHEPEDVYRPLFEKILEIAPEPIGFGRPT